MSKQFDFVSIIKFIPEILIALGVLYFAIKTFNQETENTRHDRFKPLYEAYLSLKKESYRLSLKGKEIAELKRTGENDRTEDYIEKLNIQLYMFRDTAKIYEKRYCKAEPIQKQIELLINKNDEIRNAILQNNAAAHEIEIMYREFSQSNMQCVDRIIDTYIGGQCVDFKKTAGC
ncbi:hypothetical protein J8M20_13825 [Pseudoalteromonas luteoviolacea]|uniref:hypothetical protein n=1 Tax=Pseudoalteromonas luteoviolacea TaxID=43657 RepID=UPI001B3987F0|nr:hypothetical protein [Pseudoalteromonas luteoviolacea]MBQ4812431.1 hypothetical protein [Pseudoalteromonas luteoviolacea]